LSDKIDEKQKDLKVKTGELRDSLSDDISEKKEDIKELNRQMSDKMDNKKKDIKEGTQELNKKVTEKINDSKRSSSNSVTSAAEITPSVNVTVSNTCASAKTITEATKENSSAGNSEADDQPEPKKGFFASLFTCCKC